MSALEMRTYVPSALEMRTYATSALEMRTYATSALEMRTYASSLTRLIVARSIRTVHSTIREACGILGAHSVLFAIPELESPLSDSIPRFLQIFPFPY
jgi:hypothetical protein